MEVGTNLEIDEAKEIHCDKGVSSRPDVYKHDGERLTQEQQVNKHPEDLVAS